MTRAISNMLLLLLVGLSGTLIGCGTVEPQSDEVVVVEGFLMPGASNVELRIRHSQSVWGLMASDSPVDDAQVSVSIGGQYLELGPVGNGRYSATLDEPGAPGTAVRADVRWRGASANAETKLPRPIAIDSVSIRPAARPVEAVLIDSLQIGATPPETGWLYLVDVTVFWKADVVDEETFVRARLSPEQSFVGPVLDFFLRSDHIFPEVSAGVSGDARRFEGVYAVRVDSAHAILPDHELAIALLRSGHDYARYASSRNAPERREPVGNVVGGIGIVAGVAVDSMRTLVQR
jgi:hypothetical protein